jgi:membrane fusion protein, heavy metal efflux system
MKSMQMENKMSKRMIWALALSIALLLGGAGCGKEKKEEQHGEADHEKQPNRVVLKLESVQDIGLEALTVREQSIAGSITAPAELRLNQDFEALVGTLVTGRVSKVFVRLGDHVRMGQPLMQIEGIEIGEIKASFIKAKAQLDYAAANLERQKTLTEEKISSQKSLQEAQAGYDQALAGFNAEDKRIHSVGLLDEELLSSGSGAESSEHTAGTLAIKSPIDGTVVERNVMIGQLVDEAANAFKVVNNSVLWADGQLFEKDLAFVSGKPEIIFSVTAYPAEKFSGRIIYIGEVVDDQTRTVQVRAEIKNTQRKLKSGMFGELTIPIHASKRGLAVPAESLVREGDTKYVFVAVDDTTFELRQVEPGVQAGETVEIRSGLRAGEKVAGKGVFYLKSEWKKSEFAEEEE